MTLLDQGLEPLTAHERVADPIHLARPWRARRKRHRVRQVGIALHQAFDQRVFAHTGRPRDDDQKATLRRHVSEAQNPSKSAGGGTSKLIATWVRGWRRRSRHAWSIGRSGSPGFLAP